jgi:hypothetical protein
MYFSAMQPLTYATRKNSRHDLDSHARGRHDPIRVTEHDRA